MGSDNRKATYANKRKPATEDKRPASLLDSIVSGAKKHFGQMQEGAKRIGEAIQGDPLKNAMTKRKEAGMKQAEGAYKQWKQTDKPKEDMNRQRAEQVVAKYPGSSTSYTKSVPTKKPVQGNLQKETVKVSEKDVKKRKPKKA